MTRASTASLLVGGLLAGCGSAAETASTEGETDSQVAAGQGITEYPAAAAATSEATTEEPDEATVDLEVAEYGFTQLDGGEYGSPGVSYGVIIQNNGTAIAGSAQAQISFEEHHRRRLHLPQLPPGWRGGVRLYRRTL